MKSFNFAEEAKKADTGSYLKLKEGSNPIRIASEFLLYESVYMGKKTKKFVGFIIDRADHGLVKPAFLAKTIIDQIASFQSDSEYGFMEVPMPYDINISAIGAGTKEVQYTVIPARSNTPLTADEVKAIAEAGSVEQFILQLREKEAGTEQPEPETASLDQIVPPAPEGSEPFVETPATPAPSKFAQTVSERTAGKFGTKAA